MYYSSGNYEAFARPMKPEGVDRKSAYIIGTGLAGLTAAFYLVRDGQMKGEHIHLLEKLDLAGGSCDGRKDVTKGFYMRGGREMDNHFEIMWDVYRDVPSIETEGVSVLDEYYWLNKKDPNYSLCRATVNRGQDAHTDGKFELDKESAMDLTKLFMIPEEQLEDKKISEIFNQNFWKTNFWLYWQTMFAFQRWSSALEMKRYLQRYVHHIDGLPDFSALRFTKYNQYESMILPLVKYLEAHGVKIEYGIDVKNVVIENVGGKKLLRKSNISKTIITVALIFWKPTSFSSPTAVVRIRAATATRRMPPTFRKSETVTAKVGICGRTSPHRTKRSAIPISSVRMWKRPTG